MQRTWVKKTTWEVWVNSNQMLGFKQEFLGSLWMGALGAAFICRWPQQFPPVSLSDQVKCQILPHLGASRESPGSRWCSPRAGNHPVRWAHFLHSSRGPLQGWAGGLVFALCVQEGMRGRLLAFSPGKRCAVLWSWWLWGIFVITEEQLKF